MNRAPTTLQDALERAAGGSEPALLTYVESARGNASSQTYEQLLHLAHATAAWLVENGVLPGDPVVLSLARNESFVRALWGSLFAGAIPVPLPSASNALSAAPVIERLANVCRVLGDPVVITDDAQDSDGDGFWNATPRILHLPASLDERPATTRHAARPDDTALIQFSSGSTGAPKGVVLTHANILSNLRAIQAAARVTSADVCVCWMPLHHDFGLIGFLLECTYSSTPLVLIDTSAFVRRPLLWLDTMRRYGGTITASPNFGLALVLSRLGETALWDLSGVRAVLNGGEPISPDIMRSFTTALAAHGLREESMLPVYGLAEATLAVAFPALGEKPAVARFERESLETGERAMEAGEVHSAQGVIEVVSEGRAVAGCEIRIVDDDDRVLAAGYTGHIQVRGANVTSGYYRDPEATAASFIDGWMRTGDLGVQREGALYVTGRAKDILFVNGQNFYANDIENVVTKVPGMEKRRVAACGYRAAGEAVDRLLLFIGAASRDQDAGLLTAVQRRLQLTLGLTPYAIVTLPSAEFPRTTSGKLQRHKLRERFERGDLDDAARRSGTLLADQKAAAHRAPASPTERIVHSIWARELGLKDGKPGIDERFDEMGGKSLNAVLILSELEERYDITLMPGIFVENPTVAAMAAALDRQLLRGRIPGARKVMFRG